MKKFPEKNIYCNAPIFRSTFLKGDKLKHAAPFKTNNEYCKEDCATFSEIYYNPWF